MPDCLLQCSAVHGSSGWKKRQQKGLSVSSTATSFLRFLSGHRESGKGHPGHPATIDKDNLLYVPSWDTDLIEGKAWIFLPYKILFHLKYFGLGPNTVPQPWLMLVVMYSLLDSVEKSDLETRTRDDDWNRLSFVTATQLLSLCIKHTPYFHRSVLKKLFYSNSK